ncbi:uncharacterized protein [Euwallacea fornicatus]|uniref:uncharacterized protein n=1 Tax=Euwallacea fornicatus TaxID=995702 RepID=UPI00338D6980
MRLMCSLAIQVLLLKNVFCSPIGRNDGPQEIQHAACKIFTKEIEASAKTTVTRQLKGVCSSYDLNDKFKLLHKEIQLIKEIILGRNFNKTPSEELISFDHTSPGNNKTTLYDDDYDYIDSKVQSKWKIDQTIKEIATFNDTVVESSEGALYFYYWRITDVAKLLTKRDSYISSSKFVVLGHTLKIQLYPNYLSECVGILLQPDSNSFLKKHKLYILGQKYEGSIISSSILYGIKKEEKIFKILPAMLDDNFLFNNSLILKVKIYLNS